jgi:Uma2 family endonuclease
MPSFHRFCADNRDLRIERNANGTITIMSPASFESSDLNGEVFAELKSWTRIHRSGVATESSGGFTLPDKSVLSPEVAWISNERLQGFSAEDRKHFIEVCPNFIVELASPSDSLPSLRRKMQNWLQNGIELGWLIDPKTESVEVYAQGKHPVLIQGFDNRLSGLHYLPGFEMDLSLLRR